jgi:hypothetical protein
LYFFPDPHAPLFGGNVLQHWQRVLLHGQPVALPKQPCDQPRQKFGHEFVQLICARPILQ